MDNPLYLPLLILFAGLFAGLSSKFPFVKNQLRTHQVGWLLSLFPAAAFLYLLFSLTAIQDGSAIYWQTNWLPSLDIQFSLYYDSLSAVFALLVTGIGALVVIYSGYYFKGDRTVWRFMSYMLLFMIAMLGLVMAGNLFVLFIFWEVTSVVSYLLIAYDFESAQARQGAFKALLITGGGGIVLLLGITLIGSVTGSTEIPYLLSNTQILRSNSVYPAILLLIAIAAFTKSAQTPFHIWLPEAMSAPTPASAYLHSATMVKAGIYLVARLNPILGQTETWFWVFSTIGLITMLVGAYLGLKQNDLKALLAYSTISQLGVMVLLIGQDTDIAFKALVIVVIAHALYKSALFMVAGIVDHEIGTRDLRRLGGIARLMPYSAAVATLAALSMAGLPPMFGFLAKETLLATAVHPSLPELFAMILTTSIVIAGALMLAQAGLFVWDTFFGKRRDASLSPHEAPWGMLLTPFIPAALSIMLSLLPEPERLANFLANAAGEAYGGKVKVSLSLWAGLTVPFLLSAVAVACGLLIFISRKRIRNIQNKLAPKITINSLYDLLKKGIQYTGKFSVRFQNGKLRTYLIVMLASLVALVVFFAGIPTIDINVLLQQPLFDIEFALSILRIFALLLTILSAIASVLIRRDFYAILALGAMGSSVAVLMVLEPAPDVALVQMIVDILVVVILVLALNRLPRSQRIHARELTFKQSRTGIIRDMLISLALGVIVFWMTLTALITRPRLTVLTPFYEVNAKLLTDAKDIVGAIVADFRSFDTLIEISVFSVAGLGIYTLLLFASRWAGDQVTDQPLSDIHNMSTTGIGGSRTSSFIHALAYASLPFALVLAVIQIIYGHDQPGDGFTAGVIVGLVVAFWYVVFGYSAVKSRLKWLKPTRLIGFGILIAITNGALSAWIGGNFLSYVNYGKSLNLPLPSGFSLNSPLFFEVAIFLCILGSVSYILSAMGHPRTEDETLGTPVWSHSQASETVSAEKENPESITTNSGSDPTGGYSITSG